MPPGAIRYCQNDHIASISCTQTYVVVVEVVVEDQMRQVLNLRVNMPCFSFS